jgi:hypothetical protein
MDPVSRGDVVAVGSKRRFVSREGETGPLDPFNLKPLIEATLQIE